MYGRSYQSHDHSPSHPYNTGTGHAGFAPNRQALLAPSARGAVRCPASRTKKGEQAYPVYYIQQEPLVRRTFLHGTVNVPS